MYGKKTKRKWNGLLKIISVQHISENNEILWESKNLYNTFHRDGEQFALEALFAGTAIPTNYYLGLDNRTSLTTVQNMGDIVGEPSANGYTRQSLPSTGSFTVALVSSNYQAESPIISFTANGGSFGPIKNLFLTDKSDNTGFLISSAAMPSSTTVNNGQTVNMRIALTLRLCP